MGDSPSLTASDRTAEAAGPSEPRQAAAISCNEFDNILEKCGKQVINNRHGKCCEYMSGVTMKTDSNAAQAVFRCLYTPSVCHVRKLAIKLINYIIELPIMDQRRTEVTAGANALKKIVCYNDVNFDIVLEVHAVLALCRQM